MGETNHKRMVQSVIPTPNTLLRSVDTATILPTAPSSDTGSTGGPSKATQLIPTTATVLPNPLPDDASQHGTTTMASSSSSAGLRLLSEVTNCEHNRPELHMTENAKDYDYSLEFMCDPDFRLNTKTKHPINTMYNISIKDTLWITGIGLNHCEMILKLDDGKQGTPLCSCFFHPIAQLPTDPSTDMKNQLFQAKIEIPPSINSKKGNSASRVAFVEVYDSKVGLLAYSDKIWVRSRSRKQMEKDEKTKKKTRSTSIGHIPSHSHKIPSSSEASKRKRPFSDTFKGSASTQPATKKTLWDITSEDIEETNGTENSLPGSSHLDNSFSTLNIGAAVPIATSSSYVDQGKSNNLQQPGIRTTLPRLKTILSQNYPEQDTHDTELQDIEDLIRNQNILIEDLKTKVTANTQLLHSLMQHILCDNK